MGDEGAAAAAWSGGYVTDVEYEDGYFVGQSPLRIALTCAVSGVEPPSLASGFTYCELGCGKGGTSLMLAAAHPDAEFHAIDFNPAHIGHARARAEAAGITNVTFHELDFDELARPGAPQFPMFDFITLHGVWSWVGDGPQNAIVDFLNARLRPGGAAYVSYNAMPGWSDSTPLQWLVRAFSRQAGLRSDAAVEYAIRKVGHLADVNGIPPRIRESLGRFDEVAKGGRLSYLAHEFLNEHWRAFYHFDVAKALGRAKLAFVGSTDIIRNFHNVVVTDAQMQALGEVASAELRETLKDYCTDTRFRLDVYVRGARRMTGERRDRMLGALRLTLLREPPEAFHVTLADGTKWRPEPAVFGPVFAALKKRPHRISELLSLPELPQGHTVGPGELIGVVVGGGIATVCSPPSTAAIDASRRLNADTLARLESRAFVSVPAIGGALGLGTVDQVLYAELLRDAAPDVGDLTRRLMDRCRADGGHPIVDGKAIEDPEEAAKVVSADYALRLERVAPLWRMLQMF